jgi:hypothetical protein
MIKKQRYNVEDLTSICKTAALMSILVPILALLISEILILSFEPSTFAMDYRSCVGSLESSVLTREQFLTGEFASANGRVALSELSPPVYVLDIDHAPLHIEDIDPDYKWFRTSAGIKQSVIRPLVLARPGTRAAKLLSPESLPIIFAFDALSKRVSERDWINNRGKVRVKYFSKLYKLLLKDVEVDLQIENEDSFQATMDNWRMQLNYCEPAGQDLKYRSFKQQISKLVRKIQETTG